jgi:hypothetical protein
VGDFGLEDPTENRTRVRAYFDSNCNWSPFLAAAIYFNANGNVLQFRVTFPLIAPIDETTNLVVNEALGDLDSAIYRTAYPVQDMTFILPRNLQHFPGCGSHFGYSLSFWKAAQKCWNKTFGTHLASVFGSAESEICLFYDVVPEQERHLLGLQRCYGAFDLKPGNSNSMEDHLEAFFSNEEFAEISEVDRKNLDNFLYLRKFQEERSRKSPEFQKNPELYLEDIKKFTAPPEQGMAHPTEELSTECALRIKRVGTGDWMTIETPNEIGVISLLTKSKADELNPDTMLRFEFDQWLGYQLAKCGKLKLLSLSFYPWEHAFEPCRNYFCKFASHLAYSAYYRSRNVREEYTIPEEMSSLNCLAKFGADRFLKLRCFNQDRSSVHAVGLVYDEDRIEIHGLIRVIK